MTIKSNILAALNGERPQRVPWNRHHELLSRGEFEREMRNAGLGIVAKGQSAYISITENVSVESKTMWENGNRAFYTTYHTPRGNLNGKKVIGPDGSPWVKEYPVKDVEDFPILEFITKDTVYYPDDERVLQACHTLGDDGMVLCRMLRSPLQRLLIEWMGIEAVVYAFADWPEAVENLLDTMSQADEAAFKIAAQSPAEAVWSSENITSAVTTPQLFSRYCLPYYNQMAALLHAGGKLYGIHMDGLLSGLTAVIDETQVDFIEGFTPPPMGDLDLPSAKAAWPDKALWTNFPGSVLLSSEEEIRDYTMGLLRIGMEGGRFLLTFAEDFPQPHRSLKLIGEAIQEFEKTFE